MKALHPAGFPRGCPQQRSCRAYPPPIDRFGSDEDALFWTTDWGTRARKVRRLAKSMLPVPPLLCPGLRGS